MGGFSFTMRLFVCVATLYSPCWASFRAEKRNNIVSYQILSWKQSREVENNNDCAGDKFVKNESKEIESVDGILYVYYGYSIGRYFF